jgi:hypothetical protein
MKLEFPLQILEKYSNIKFNENLSSGSQVVPCGRTGRQRDTRKLRAALEILRKLLKKIPA